MITINFFKDGAYIKGHDEDKICTLISYAMYSCINDCIEANQNVYHYQSANYEDWQRLGLTYVKIDLTVEEHVALFYNFKSNLWSWLSELYPERVKINNNENELIDWDKALKDAKQEQGIV